MLLPNMNDHHRPVRFGWAAFFSSVTTRRVDPVSFHALTFSHRDLAFGLPSNQETHGNLSHDSHE
jgi:hypothetical protein